MELGAALEAGQREKRAKRTSLYARVPTLKVAKRVENPRTCSAVGGDSSLCSMTSAKNCWFPEGLVVPWKDTSAVQLKRRIPDKN